MNGPTNVERLRQAGVLPEGSTLESEDETAINDLSEDEVNAVLDVHSKVGTIELTGDPQGRMFIF
jgi:hypothetical protein